MTINKIEENLKKLEQINNKSYRPLVKFDWLVDKISNEVVNTLKEKNKAYGDSALNPINIFSKLESTEGLCARLDDKLARIKNKGITDKTEDTIIDIIGYLILLKMSMYRDV